VPDATLTEQWSLLHRMGARHLAYYPDDFLNDQPSLATVRRALSVRATLQGESDGLDTPPALAAPKDVPPIVDVEPAPIDGTAPVKVQPR
jgi:biofilm PGA synthesis lipoprotein PgaB